MQLTTKGMEVMVALGLYPSMASLLLGLAKEGQAGKSLGYSPTRGFYYYYTQGETP